MSSAARLAGVPFHRARAEASRCNGALDPDCAEARLRVKYEAGRRPRPRRWRVVRTADAKRTRTPWDSERTQAELEFERTQLRVGTRTNPSRSKAARARVPSKPNEPKLVERGQNPA
jgi:hypothetical protein